jgi:hypothetical protein
MYKTTYWTDKAFSHHLLPTTLTPTNLPKLIRTNSNYPFYFFYNDSLTISLINPIRPSSKILQRNNIIISN